MTPTDTASVLRALLTRGRRFPESDEHAGVASEVADEVPSEVGQDSDDWRSREAELLYVAEARRCAAVLLSRRRPGVSLSDAYRVQWYGAALRVSRGARVVGHKVGLTSPAMQAQVGIDTPDSGILLDRMAVASGGVLRAEDLIRPRVEAEIAFRLGADLRGVDVTEHVARAAVAEVFLALEVIDSRFGLDGITLADSVADNAACARFVLGPSVPMPAWDVRTERVTVHVGAALAAQGTGLDVLGDPVRSVVWLAHQLAPWGAGLHAGDIVLAGAVHASIPLPTVGTVSACSLRLPAVSLAIE
jgi:2-keto-4-pentenoate hydratase